MWDDGTIWDSAEDGQLLLKSCRQCGDICHPPLPMCPQCQSLEWDSLAVSGQALLKSWLASTRPDQSEQVPRIVIVAQLQEGVAFVSNLIDASLEDLCEDMPLEFCFERVDATVLPLFRPKGLA